VSEAICSVSESSIQCGELSVPAPAAAVAAHGVLVPLVGRPVAGDEDEAIPGCDRSALAFDLRRIGIEELQQLLEGHLSGELLEQDDLLLAVSVPPQSAVPVVGGIDVGIPIAHSVALADSGGTADADDAEVRSVGTGHTGRKLEEARAILDKHVSGHVGDLASPEETVGS